MPMITCAPEGWDNPNVFQICTLNETRSVLKKRQEIGRGLRLPVNQNGERVFDENINKLLVVANESYEDFARTLQTEYEDDCGVTFGKVPKTAFSALMRVLDGEGVPLGRDTSVKIFDGLVAKGFIGEDGKIKPTFDPKAPGFDLASVRAAGAAARRPDEIWPDRRPSLCNMETAAAKGLAAPERERFRTKGRTARQDFRRWPGQLHADAGDADKLAAAQVPAFAAALTPHDSRANANRTTALAGDRQFDLAREQFHVVDQPHAGGRDFAREGRIATAIGGVHRHAAKEGIAKLVTAVVIVFEMCLDNQLVNGHPRLHRPLDSVRHGLRAPVFEPRDAGQ